MRLFFICLSVSLVLAQERKYYDRKYDYFDIDHLIENPRLLQKYLDCFVDKGPCTPVGRVFKQALPEVVRSACGKCTPAQFSLTRKTFDAFKQLFPEDHAELKKKLDPRNKYFESFEKAIANAS